MYQAGYTSRPKRPRSARTYPRSRTGRQRQQNFHRFLQLPHVTNVVIGSSADRVCFCVYVVFVDLHLPHSNMPWITKQAWNTARGKRKYSRGHISGLTTKRQNDTTLLNRLYLKCNKWGDICRRHQAPGTKSVFIIFALEWRSPCLGRGVSGSVCFPAPLGTY